MSHPTSTPGEIQMLWTKINKPTHPAVLELVERYASDILKWNSEAFDAEYAMLERRLLDTIVLPEDVPTSEELSRCSGNILGYETYKMFTPRNNYGRSLQVFVNKTQCYHDSVHEHFTRINSWLSLLRDAMWNMEQHITRMRREKEEALIQAEKTRLKAIEERKARQVAEEEREARRRLAAIEWEAGRIAREAAKRLEEKAREARILAKMDELRKEAKK